MNRKSIQVVFTAILLIMLLPLAPSRTEAAVPAHSESFYVNDFADVIDQKTENYMVNYGVKLHQQTGAQVVLVTVDSTGGTSMEDYATSLFNEWGVGSADKNNGVLLLLSIKDDDYWAVPGKGLEDTLNDNVLSRILSESLEPDFAKKDYSAGARRTYGSLIQSLGGVYSETLGSKNYISDNAGVLKQVTKDYLNQSSNRYAATTGSGIYVVTVKNSGDKSLQDYTYAKFAGVAAGPKDVMLVLDIGGDNYHVLQGKAIEGTFTNELIGGILDTLLEPEFAAKDYAGGATATANAFYSFFLARADASQETAAMSTKSAAAAGSKSPVKSDISSKPKPVSASTGLKIIGVYLIIIALISLAASGRNRLIARFGSRLNPFNQQNMNRLVTRFGSGSTMRQRRHRRHERHRNEALNHSSSQSSFWGSNEGGGGSSNGGGVGRYSSYEDEDENEGGGGSTNGGGAGRYSSYDDDDDGDNSGGGGSASSGGGVGRHR
ncbi:TPM domain-containing protein [Paenibacillus borealis]|uniref:TPM domain-containing protein n=1 Tax=Paenibacillus borealis TaxID=160799 RepID=UPI000694663D|nr:TPM domain-containing protein [Paenibacillus borealis]